MRNHRSLRRCGAVMVAGVALLALGPAQLNTPNVTHPDLSRAAMARQAAHAPLILRTDPDGNPLFGPRHQSVSSNWSGYALSTGNSGNYASASFSWTISSATYINYGGINPYSFNDSSQWVGIGGDTTQDLIQLGSDSYVDSTGTPSYSVWYEELPADSTNLTGCTPAAFSSCPVNPGDAMTASLACTSNCTANNSNTTWTLAMADTTKGWSWTGNFTYESCLCSAEWIEEAPFYSEIAAISNFGTAPFSNLTLNGVSPGLSLASAGIMLQDPEGGYASPCQAFNGNQVGSGNQFVVAYGQACISTFDSHDFNNDAKSDIGWRNTSTGDVAIWLMNGTTISKASDFANVAPASNWSIVGARDFNGDGKADLLWHNSNGTVSIWLMNGTTISQSATLGVVPTSWAIAGTGDFNGDGRGDILWSNTSTGDVSIWLMNGTSIIQATDFANVPVASGWTIAGTGDFNADGMSDILWRNTSTGDVSIWLMNGTTISQATDFANVSVASGWQIAGTGDFNGDGKTDILWRNTSTGDVSIWLMNGTAISQAKDFANVPIASNWVIAQTGDLNGDGMSDILWRNTSTGDVSVWLMNGTTISQGTDFANAPVAWVIQGLNGD